MGRTATLTATTALILLSATYLLYPHTTNVLSDHIKEPIGHSEQHQQQQYHADGLSEEQRAFLSRRAQERRDRTRPPILLQTNNKNTTTNDNSKTTIPPYQLKLQLDDAFEETQSNNNDDDNTSNTMQYCLPHTNTLAAQHPHLFSPNNALTPKSKVYISGILGPLGSTLARTLQQRCGVTLIGGSDPMLPSTISYRLQYMERMQRLLHTLPKLSKKTSPVTLTYLGLHPKIKAAAHNTQTTTYDIYRKFQPTHVVHLTAVEGDVLYSSSDVHGISPYGDQPPLHQVRQCSVAMEQCLTSVARAKRRPMLVYATSLSDNPKLVDSNGSIQHTMGMMDEVMASVYGRVEGVKTIGLRLGRVYGPWMRPNDVMYDMARRAVRGDPILVDGSDDDTAGMDMVYVEDVVEALITAMQMSPPDSTGDDDKNSGVIHMDTVAPSTTMPHIAALMQDALTTNNNNNEEDESGPMTSSLHYTNGKLHYTPHTPLTAGIIKTLAWHTRQEYPYSTPPYPNMASLASGGYDTLPCASECVPEGSNRCSPSTLDNVVVLSREYSRGCNVVMYTLVLGGDEVRLPLPTSKSPQFVYDEQGGEMVCKFAYVNQGSGLVKDMVHHAAKNDQQYLQKAAEGNLVDDKSFSNLKNRDLCVDLPAFNTIYSLKLYKCNGGGNQRWFLDPSNRIRSALDEDQCVFAPTADEHDAVNAADGDNSESVNPLLYVHKCDLYNDHQVWQLTQEGRFRSKVYPSKVIGVTKCNADSKATLELQEEGACAMSQRWFMSSTPPPLPPLQPLNTSTNTDPGTASGDASSNSEEDYIKFNGKLVHQGWTLVWFTPGEFMTAPELLLGKLSPGKLFAPSVRAAMFIDSFALATTPVTEDLLFLTDHITMHQEALPSRRDSIRLSDGKKRSFQLAPEPERHALMIVSPMRLPGEDENGKIPLTKIVAKMMEDNNMGKSASTHYVEPPEITAQRTFYEKTSSFVNKLDLRSIYEPIYQFRLNHFIKTRWIVHDLQREEARNFRCEWYKEQADWDSDIDQLGFAYVMAKRGLQRMIGREEPDERAKLHIPPEPPEIDDLTDKKEWFEILNEKSSTGWIKDGEKIDAHSSEDTDVHAQDVNVRGDDSRYFIRIMSNREMWYRRRSWNKIHASSILRKFQ